MPYTAKLTNGELLQGKGKYDCYQVTDAGVLVLLSRAENVDKQVVTMEYAPNAWADAHGTRFDGATSGVEGTSGKFVNGEVFFQD